MAIGLKVKQYRLAKIARLSKLEGEKYIPVCFVCQSRFKLEPKDLSNGKVIFQCPAHRS